MESCSGMEVLIHYGDLYLKRKNRGDFVRRLAQNIEHAAGGRCEAQGDRIIMRGGDPSVLKNVFGISWYAPCQICSKDMESIVKLASEGAGRMVRAGTPKKTFAVYTKRSDKTFPVKSSEISNIVGDEIRRRLNLKVNISDPDLPVYIEVATKSAQVHFEKQPGAGGLPVGASAPVLCLLSGGIDSPVAAIAAMKRGCEVDFLHFHVFPDSAPVMESKIPDIFAALGRYQRESKMFLASYKFFHGEILRVFPAANIFRGYELVLFRRFMLKVAQSLALRHGYKGVVTGDSIGQVASQTIENIAGAYTGLDCLVLSPLLGWDKKEIVAKAREAGTYGHSIAAYNECCSLVSASPRTKCRMGTLRRLEEIVSMDSIVDSTVNDIERFIPVVESANEAY